MKIFAAAFVLGSLFASGLVAGADQVRPDTFYIQVSNHTGDTIYALLAGVGPAVGVKAPPDESSDWETFKSTQSTGSLSYNCGGNGHSGMVWLKLSQPHILVTVLSNCEHKVTYS
jgi:hypothetical protein